MSKMPLQINLYNMAKENKIPPQFKMTGIKGTRAEAIESGVIWFTFTDGIKSIEMSIDTKGATGGLKFTDIEFPQGFDQAKIDGIINIIYENKPVPIVAFNALEFLDRKISTSQGVKAAVDDCLGKVRNA
jgi:hypothetical protein